MLTNLLIILGCTAALIGGAMVLLSKRPTRSLLGLFITAFFVGILFLLLGGFYIAMVQIIIYAGVILVLFLFVVRFFSITSRHIKNPWQIPLGVVTVMILFLQILTPSVPYLQRGLIEQWDDPPDVAMFGEVFFQNYLYPFELIGVLILVAIVSAIYMAREDDENTGQEEDNQ